MSTPRWEKVFCWSVKTWVCAVLLFAVAPPLAFAGAYTTSISPSGAQILSPITATFNIQDFAGRDFGTQCTTGFVPAEIRFNYWFDQGSDFNEIQPPVIPTSEMIESGIYTAVLNLSAGQAVDSIGAEFFQFEGGSGIKCGFYGRQPNGVSEEPWSEPAFTVIAAPATVYVSASSFQNQAPFVSFTAFPEGKTLSGRKVILYSAIDYDRAPFGLKDFPINFYLSNDGGAIWKELIKNESNKGEYSFDTNNFPDGTNYKLKVVVLDNNGQSGEAVSGTFGIDNSLPVFEVLIDAESIKEKDKINLKITSSESLMETPTVQITQSGGESQTLVVDGFGKKFSATYLVLKGHLGNAVISIKGKDLAGNSGEKISSGETFIVSRLGPPPPTIKNIINNESFSDPKIDILGSAPLAREIIFIFNKKDKFTIKPNEDGDFSFKNITLSSLDFGHNTLSFSSIDKDGLESDLRILTVKLNNPPTVSWIQRPSGTISGAAHLEWKALDANNDELVFSLWYSMGGGKNWDFISKGLLTNQYELNTEEFFDSDNYVVKLTVDDGSITSDLISEKLIFRNNNFFSITDAPKNYIFDTTKPVFKGEVKISPHEIVSLKFSLEKETWLNAEAIDGKFNSSFEKFLIKFPEPFIDGKHVLFIEAKDDTGGIFRTFQTFVIDTLPPVVSEIDFPSSNETIDTSHDIDSRLGGIQVDVLGKAEAGADLELAVNNRVYVASADNKGNFIFKKVTFLSHGINRYVLSSSDAANNLSKIEGLILSNSAPTLSFVTTQKGDFLQGVKEVKWRALDKDDDTLIFQISYRHKGDKNWISLDSSLTGTSYKLDFSKFKEGAYELQVIANDGLTETSVVEDIFIDNVLPTIKFDSVGSRTVSKLRLIFSGSAEDNLSGVKFVEYSLDGKSWFKAIIADGYLQKKASFVIRHPFELEDGAYAFGVRAVDAAGNISKPIFENIVVDSTSPRIGSFLISYKNMTVFPTSDSFEIPMTTSVHIVISLEHDTQSASLVLDAQENELSKNKSSGLWETDFLTGTQGTSTLLVTARDSLGNETAGTAIGGIRTVPRGKTVSNAKITVLLRREDQSLVVWPAKTYRAENPLWSDENGEYTLLLPAGKYQLLVEKSGYQRSRVSDFEILTPRFLSFDLPLKPRAGLRGFLEDVLERVSF